MASNRQRDRSCSKPLSHVPDGLIFRTTKRSKSCRLLLGFALAVALLLTSAGCSQQQGTAGATTSAGPSSTLSAPPTPAPAPTPVNPDSKPSTISGNYTLYRYQKSCGNYSNGCYANPMKIRIACNGGSCTVIRTNSAAGYAPWSHTIPLTYDGTFWKASGSERNASECDGNPAPTSVRLELSIVSAQVANGIWKAQQLMGSYISIQGPTVCNNYSRSKGVQIVSTSNLSVWPGAAALAKVEQIAALIWQVVDNGNTLCDIFKCKFVPPKVSKLISIVSKAQQIGDLTAAALDGVKLGTDLAALNASLKGHTKGAPFSAQTISLAKKVWNDNRSLQLALEDLVPGLSLKWPVPAPK